MRKFVLSLIAAAFLGGCSDGAGPESSSLVSIKFGIAGSTANPSSPASFSVAGGAAGDVPSHIEGSNGDLNLTAIWVIVEEFELEPVEHICHDDFGGHEHCPDFEREYFFIGVPVDGSTVDVVTAGIPDGTYDELEFEVENVEIDDDDPEDMEESDLIMALITMIEDAGFSMWPEKASLVVIGTFTPKDADGMLGTAVPFETYFEAEIEVEMDLDPVLEIKDEAVVGGGAITIYLLPDRWFTRTDGTVWNLAELQDELVEFELEIEDGFKLEIEIDDDD